MYRTQIPKTSSILLPTPSNVRLTRFDRWWANLMPPVLKRVLPPWQISAGLVTLVAFYTADQLLTTLIMLFWASMSFTWLFSKLQRHLKQFRWIIPAYHAGLYPWVVMPAVAQAGGNACSSQGLLSKVGNFVSQLFSTVTFGGAGGGTLSTMICQVVGFLTVFVVISFIGVLAYVSYQMGQNQQPASVALNPLMGFLVFAGGSTFIIAVMLGTGTTGV